MSHQGATFVEQEGYAPSLQEILETLAEDSIWERYERSISSRISTGFLVKSSAASPNAPRGAVAGIDRYAVTR